MRKNLLLAASAALALSLVAAAPASALTLVDFQLANPAEVVHIGLTGENVYDAPGSLKFAENPDFLSPEWCLSVLQNIGLGAQPSGETYHKAVLTSLTDLGGGHFYNDLQISQMSWVMQQNAFTDALHMNARQYLIWDIQGANVSGGSAALQATVAEYAAHLGTSDRPIYAYISDSGNVQPFGNGVPEPATWAMLIFGLFGAGAALRNMRRQYATA